MISISNWCLPASQSRFLRIPNISVSNNCALRIRLLTKGLLSKSSQLKFYIFNKMKCLKCYIVICFLQEEFSRQQDLEDTVRSLKDLIKERDGQIEELRKENSQLQSLLTEAKQSSLEDGVTILHN